MKAWNRRLVRVRDRYPRWLLDKCAKGRPPRIAQRVESWLMLWVAAARLRREHPQVPLVTCHDSMLTIKPFLSLAKDAIGDAFGMIGLKPIIKPSEAAK